jgi:hypothetical protein
MNSRVELEELDVPEFHSDDIAQKSRRGARVDTEPLGETEPRWREPTPMISLIPPNSTRNVCSRTGTDDARSLPWMTRRGDK